MGEALDYPEFRPIPEVVERMREAIRSRFRGASVRPASDSCVLRVNFDTMRLLADVLGIHAPDITQITDFRVLGVSVEFDNDMLSPFALMRKNKGAVSRAEAAFARAKEAIGGLI